MVLKGTILPDHMAINSYELIVLGLPPLTFTKISGLEDETDKTKLPDRTVASGGNSQPVEFTADLPLHHTIEMAAMELWFAESGARSGPVLPTYKKPATLIFRSISGLQLRSYALVGLWPFKQKLPDLAMDNQGDAAMCMWSFSADQKFPLG